MPREAEPPHAASRPALSPALRRLASIVKAIFGMPDYARYLEHHDRLRPGQAALSRREHYLQYLEHRYRGRGLRCC
jgi:uncharacterized short protein YbdD (DUF466 family)